MSNRQVEHLKRQAKNRRIYGPEEKAQMTMGRIAGRATLRQRDFLTKRGYDRDKVSHWTANRASQEIAKILETNP